MKKTYMKPETLSVSIQMAAMIAASDSVTSDQLDGVTYGGIDETIPPHVIPFGAMRCGSSETHNGDCLNSPRCD